MYNGFILEDGRKIVTPWLDGVLERAYRLAENWVDKDPSLEPVPFGLLLLHAIECVDVMRLREELEKGGLSREEVTRKAHSHLSETLKLTGLVSFLAENTWKLTQTAEDLTAPPVFHGFKNNFQGDIREPLRRRVTEKELRNSSGFRADIPEAFGLEATEHLLQAILAYDKWVHRLHKQKREVSPNRSLKRQIITTTKGPSCHFTLIYG